jgi:WD40 repeat protein
MPVSVALFSPDGRELFIGGGLPGLEGLSQKELVAFDKTVAISNAFWLFTAEGRRITGPVRVGEATPTAATFSRSGRLLIVGDSAGDVHFFDQRGRVVRPPLRVPVSRSSPMMHGVTALALSNDEHTLAVAHAGMISSQSPVELNLWDLRAKNLVAKLTGHLERINALAFSPSGDMLASAGGEVSFIQGRSDYGIRLWAYPSGHALSPAWAGHEARVVALTFTDGGRGLASIDADGALHHWRVGWREWAQAAEERGEEIRRAAESQVLRVLSEQHVAAGNYRLALEAIERASTIRQSPDLLWSRAQILTRLGRLDEALAAQTAAIELSRFDAVRIFERGKLRLRLARAKEALVDFTLALELAPFVIRPAPVIAEHLPWNRQVHDIATDLSKIVVADVRLHRAIAHLMSGDVASAENDINQAYVLGLRSRDFYLTRARVKRVRGDESGAREDERLADQARSPSHK